MPKRLSTKEFIQKAKTIHKNKYSYAKTEYVNSLEKVVITCKKHGDFEQKPREHIGGNGCSVCGSEKTVASKKISTKEFIQKAKTIHKNKYSYAKTEYVNSLEKVVITCKKHGDFEQKPREHIKGSGCQKCGILKKGPKKYTKKQFIRKAIFIHQEKYNYEKFLYEGSKVKAIIKCMKHGDFMQTPSDHLQGQGCPKCGILKRSKGRVISKKEFIKRANLNHHGFYNYKKTKLINLHKKVIITCPLHGDFKQNPNNHLKGSGCLECSYEKSGNRPLNNNNFIKEAKKIHDDRYDYSLAHYKNMHSPIKILCSIHGEFLQTPTQHIHRGSGCPKCVNKSEGRIAEYLIKKNIVYRQYKLLHKNKNKFYDFFLPEYNLIIERDGEQHYLDHRNFSKSYQKRNIKNDALKTNLALKAGFKIARIPYWLSKDEEKIELENILAGHPTYPNIPDLKQSKVKPKPKNNL